MSLDCQGVQLGDLYLDVSLYFHKGFKWNIAAGVFPSCKFVVYILFW